MRPLIAAVVAILTAIVGLVIFPSLASAHANVVSGEAACQSATGTYTITWTVANDYNQTEAVALQTSSGGTVSGLPLTLLANNNKFYADKTVTQSGVSGSAKSASLTVTGTWADKFSQSDAGQIKLSGTCKVVVPPSGTTAAPSSTQPVCANPNVGSITLSPAAHVIYSIDGTPVAAGSTSITEAPGSYHVTAAAEPGFTLTGASWWPAIIIAAPTDCVTAAAATFADFSCFNATSVHGTLTIPVTAHVNYFVPAAGSSVPATTR
jgi:hypothetical protein